MHESDERGGYVCMGVARVKGAQADGSVDPRPRLHPALPEDQRLMACSPSS